MKEVKIKLKMKSNIFEKEFKLLVLVLSIFLNLVCFSLLFSNDNKNDFDERIEILANVLKSTSAKERLNAIYELLRIDDERAKKLLLEHYKVENDNYLKKEIIENIDISFSTEAVQLIVESIENPNKQIALSALNRVNEEMFKDKNLKNKVINLFKNHKDEDIKLEAMRVISVVKSSDVIKEITDCIIDEKMDIEMRLLCVRIIKGYKDDFAKKELDRIRKSNIKDEKLREELGIKERMKNNDVKPKKQNIKTKI